MADFGDIRSLLQHRPSAKIWRELCSTIDQFDEQQLRQRILPYVDGYMRDWPDYLRIAPKHWLKAYLTKGASPQLAVARCIKSGDLTQLDLEKLAKCEDIRELDALYLQNSFFSPEVIATLLKSPMAQKLKTLYIAHSYLTDDEVEALCKIEQLSQLHTLDLRYNRISDKSAKILADCEHLQSLNVLDLRYNQINIEGTKALVDSPNLRNLYKLDLQSNQLSTPEIHTLLKHERFQRVATVELVSYDISPGIATNLVERDLQILAKTQPSSVIWRRVCKLIDKIPQRYLNAAFITWMNEQFEHWPDELRVLTDEWRKVFGINAHHPKFSLLRSLNLWNMSLYRYQFDDLTSSPSLDQLTILNLDDCNIGRQHIELFVTSPIMQKLKSLSMSNCKLRGTGVIELLKQPWVANLEYLKLDHNFLGNSCIEALCNVPFHSLKSLSLNSININTYSIDHFINAQHFDTLQSFSILGNRLGADSLEQLQHAKSIPEHLRGLDQLRAKIKINAKRR